MVYIFVGIEKFPQAIAKDRVVIGLVVPVSRVRFGHSYTRVCNTNLNPSNRADFDRPTAPCPGSTRQAKPPHGPAALLNEMDPTADDQFIPVNLLGKAQTPRIILPY